MILQSFCPSGGSVESVIVYLSDFGQQRLLEEETRGPQGIFLMADHSNINNKNTREEDEEEHEVGGDEGSEEEGDDFIRPPGKEGVGLVFHDDLIAQNGRRGKSGFDEVALRRYERDRLKYYFAIATCDSCRTAEVLHSQLDQVEVENSATSLVYTYITMQYLVRQYTHNI